MQLYYYYTVGSLYFSYWYRLTLPCQRGSREMTHGSNYWYYLPLKSILNHILKSLLWKVGCVFALLTAHQTLAIHTSYVHLVTHFDDRSVLNVIVTGQLVSRNSTRNWYEVLINDQGHYTYLRKRPTLILNYR